MRFTQFVVYALSAYLFYYFAIILWDSVFRKKSKENKDVSFSLKDNSTEFTPEDVNEDDYLPEKKKVIPIPSIPEFDIPVEGQGIKVTKQILRDVMMEGKGLFQNVRGLEAY